MKANDHNPKTAVGQAKPQMSNVPPATLLHLAQVHRHGAEKYAPFNWRESEVSESTYYDAAMRHLMVWWDGQDIDPDSGCHHLAHVMTCCSIVLDADAQGMLIRNRPIRGKSEKIAGWMTEQETRRQAPRRETTFSPNGAGQFSVDKPQYR